MKMSQRHFCISGRCLGKENGFQRGVNAGEKTKKTTTLFLAFLKRMSLEVPNNC